MSKTILYSLGIAAEILIISALVYAFVGCGGSGGQATAFVEQTICIEEITTEGEVVCVSEVREVIAIPAPAQ